MSSKKKIQLEFIVHASERSIYSAISTPSGLAEWFCDDVNVNKDIYTFIWDGSPEEAELLGKKTNAYIKFHWVADEEEKSFFEFRLRKDEMTNEIALIVTDFVEEDEEEEAILLWENQINDLKHSIGG